MLSHKKICQRISSASWPFAGIHEQVMRELNFALKFQAVA